MNEKIVTAYYKYMVDIAVIFGAQRETAMKELKESLEFEMALANVSNTNIFRSFTQIAFVVQQVFFFLQEI